MMKLRLGKFLPVVLFLLSGLMYNPTFADEAPLPSEKRSTEPEITPFAIGSDGHSIFANVAAKVRPAVVFIKTERKIPEQERDDRLERFRPFEFFRDLIPDPHPQIQGGGSGFFIDDEGRILTNYHVIKDAETITVVVGEGPDEEIFEAEIVGYDSRTDIAIIQIEEVLEHPIVTLGDSDEMLIGDWVMAIGTPFGELSGTVTVGIVSAKRRSGLNIIGGEADYQDYIQTDASINFGNSGGPLVNLRGEAIGINAAINPTGQGIGFAIPINMAKQIMGQLIEKGHVEYGYLGIYFDELNKTLAQGLGLDIERGILVNQVLEDTPAERAGLQHHDIIIEFDGKPVRDGQRFRLMVGNTPVGSEVPIVIIRDGKRKKLNISIEERPPDRILLATPETRREGWLGLQVDDISSPAVREQFRGTKRSEKGVYVLRVEPGSPAARAGIEAGDIITEVYSHSVPNLESYVEISEKLKDREDPIAFLVKRGRNSIYIPVIPEKKRK
ncbi:MAG: PDZ domain-containing protein [Candidatus Latescibacteria bacterium]|nr:PDZ domain-containing protein [Candidatus Latescibacterota bacterium]NIM21593.1 PDZ domain-containing protein [Candidatus Latescibacterota bacterium]NIM64572.1 PDZ domain-containing protein [Candidatus Latescibacterota bacterium]NIO01087.1 PDZ domain-containing protein [Candidatus Latescibacterota bacterium]NIO27480.1 PDZ domain-containing protein [Candidatus Latescibacterota bacterium]